MPILDPVSQSYLLRVTTGTKSKYSKLFLLRYLKIASRNIYRSSKTIEASIRFKKDFKNSIYFLNKKFGCNFSKDFSDLGIKNYYQYLYDHISQKYKDRMLKNLKGHYRHFYAKLKLNCFQPFVDFPNGHSWFLSTDPVAILAIREQNFPEYYKREHVEDLIKLINLEIDLMNAAGFTVVLCYSTEVNNDFFSLFINEVIAVQSLAEIHFTAHISKKTEIPVVDNFFRTLLDSYSKIKGYFYYYSKFINDKYEDGKQIFKELKEMPRFQYTFFSKDPYYAFQSLTHIDAKPFPFCKTGFEEDKICVRLCNVPLYKSDNEEAFISSNITKISEGYISANDFLNFEKTRVRILFNNVDKNNRHIYRYINFDDIHRIKPDLYVDDTMSLAKTDKETLKIIEKVEEEISDKDFKYDEFKKESIFSFFKNKMMQKGLSYVSFAYMKNAQRFIPNFKLHKNQIFTAIEACKTCLFEEKRTSKGVVYQVETGEGKSCIIQVIASVLALMKKTVHITSSNINLSNRDYYNSFYFFKMLGLSSAVLLHYNELPYISFNNSSMIPDENKIYDMNCYPKKFFASKLFHNSSNMNFSVCGINNDNEIYKDKANIIFSTFVNFESLYLRMMETCPAYIDDYFKNCSLLIDEADSILIDELANGTILSRTIKTNANDILKYVYQAQIKNVPVRDAYKYVKENWPECADLKLQDIEFMYEEIELVNQEEFIDGKKYSIEEIEFKDDSNILDEVKKAIEIGKQKAKSAASNFFLKIFKKNKAIENNNDDNEISKDETDQTKDKKDEGEISKEENENDDKKDKNKEETDQTKDKNDKVEGEVSKEENENDDKKDKKKGKKDKNKEENNASEDENDQTKDKNDKYEGEVSKDESENGDDKKEKKKDKKKDKKGKTKEENDIGNDEKDENKDDKDKKKKDKKKNKKGKTKKNKKIKTIKTIIPFDYDHKGILEPNKEFSGFVQQFIAIKEINNNEEENENLVIKDVSMNYLFVSHPIFAKMYGGVVGLTGTIGNKYDKQILNEQYNLETKKIPRHNPNLRVDYPIVLCEDIVDRNYKIASEVESFHKKRFPVLVIFQDLNEIADVLYLLISKGIKNINIFDGKDENIKPDMIAGMKGAVSLGTNVCGRGTDILKPVKPLHVIISYFSSNVRVMSQAFGRTARQGQEGSVRIICIKDEFLLPIIQYNSKDMNCTLDDFKYKNDLQIRFINSYRDKRKWVFSGGITSQKLTDNLIATLREVRINVNRIKACNFEFPICMSIPTFLLIQAQKIFSLFNCPNCRYTWMLFQKYIREMILESWSLMIDNSEKKYYKKEREISYREYLEKKVEKLDEYIKEYLPDSTDMKKYEIIPTFMHIFLKVAAQYQSIIMDVYPEKLTRVFKQPGTNRFASFTIGFKPYSLVTDSGARINTADGTNQEMNFISDPELKYVQMQPSGQSILISITQKIDGIFNWICQKINDVIGSYIGLKFFLRRTLAGCEFGVCLDLDLELISEKGDIDHNCIIDKDPLLLFTISVRSLVPLLAGILIIGLVFLAAISGSIAEWIAAFPAKLTKTLVKKTLSALASTVLKSQIRKICDAICAFLLKVLDKNIQKLAEFNPEMAEIFSILMKISGADNFKFSGNKINEIFGDAATIKMKTNFGEILFQNALPFGNFLKIGLLILLCFSSFMLVFHFHRSELKYNDTKAAKEYDDKQDPEKALDENKNVVEDDSLGQLDDINNELEEMEDDK